MCDGDVEGCEDGYKPNLAHLFDCSLKGGIIEGAPGNDGCSKFKSKTSVSGVETVTGK